MIVKVCGITRREDALAAVEAGATAIGFVFHPASPRYIAPERAAEIGANIPIWKVGVFVDQSGKEIESIARQAGLDIAQVYGIQRPGGVRIWRASRVLVGEAARRAPGISFEPDGPRDDGSGTEPDEATLLDGPSNGASFPWYVASHMSAPGPLSPRKLIIAGGLDASNVREAIRQAQPWGVDASSRLESAPGVKDHDKVRQFVKAALTETA